MTCFINDMWSELIAVYEAAKTKKCGTRVDLDNATPDMINTHDIVRTLNSHFKGRLEEADARLWTTRIRRALVNREQTMFRLRMKRKEALQLEVEQTKSQFNGDEERTQLAILSTEFRRSCIDDIIP